MTTGYTRRGLTFGGWFPFFVFLGWVAGHRIGRTGYMGPDRWTWSWPDERQPDTRQGSKIASDYKYRYILVVRRDFGIAILVVRRDFGALTSIQDGLHSAAGFISWAAGQVLAGSVAFGTLGFMAYICWFG